MNTGRSRTAAWLLFMASAAVLFALSSLAPIGIASDQAQQVRAVRQFLSGVSPSPNHLVQVDPVELDRDRASWLTWWPPGFNLVMLPGLDAGVSLGPLLRAYGAICLLLGGVGWLIWARGLGLCGGWLIALAIAIPWARYTSSFLLEASAEPLAFALTPFCLIAVARADQSWQEGKPAVVAARRGILAGGLAGVAYVAKYSLALVVVPALAWCAWRGLRSRSVAGAAGVAATGIVAAIPVLTLNYLNAHFSGSINSAAQTLAPASNAFANLVAAATRLPLALADLGAPAQWAFTNPSSPVASGWLNAGLAVSLVGLPGLLALAWLFWRHPPKTAPESLAVFAAGGAVLLLTAIWTFSGAADQEVRHLMQAGLCLLPLVLLRVHSVWQRRSLIARGSILLFVTVFFLLPLVYGMASVLGKIERNRADLGSPDGLWVE
jgi:hypothetical protein